MTDAAVATWALVAVTGIAAAFGVPAAIAAAKTFRLESEPMVLIRKLETEEHPPIDPSRLMRVFMIAGTPTLYDGIELREERPSDKDHVNFDAAVSSGAIIELHNAGRAPALGVKVPFKLRTSMFLEVDPGTDLPQIGTQEGRGALEVPGIEANASAYVRVENLIGNVVILDAEDFGTRLEIGDRKRRQRALPIVAVRPLRIPSAV